MLKKLYESDRIDEFITSEEVREVIYDSYDAPSFSGWGRDIIYNYNDDTLSLSGNRSHNTMSVNEYNGEEISLFNIPTNSEIGEIINTDNIGIILEENPKILEKYNELNNTSLNDETFIDEVDYEDFIKENFEEIYNEYKENLIDNYVDADIDCMETDIYNNINNAIETMDN